MILALALNKWLLFKTLGGGTSACSAGRKSLIWTNPPAYCRNRALRHACLHLCCYDSALTKVYVFLPRV